MQTYRGSCHCGNVVFELDTDLDHVNVCNCSICLKKNAVMHRVPANQFRLIAGEDALVSYTFNTGAARHYFCGTCGIYPFHRPRIDPSAYTVNVMCLDGVDRDLVEGLHVNRLDGRSFSTADE